MLNYVLFRKATLVKILFLNLGELTIVIFEIMEN